MMTIFLNTPEWVEVSSWIRKTFVIVVGRSFCDTKSVSAKMHY
jgi:hypothetical protein